MTLARIAKQLDASEVDEFQRAARTLLAHPVVTSTYPRGGVLSSIRRYETVLRNEFGRVLHYRLDVGPSCARLTRRPATLSSARHARTATEREFKTWTYTFVCLVLAAFESLGEQTSLSQIAEEIARLRAGDTELPVDLKAYEQRRAFVDAVAWLEHLGILAVEDGATESFMSGEEGDALYNIDRDAASRLLVASPSVIREVRTAADFLKDTYPPGPEGDLARVRYAVTRRIVDSPAVYYAEIPADELAYLRQNRGWLCRDIELLTGCSIEARTEGVSLIDSPVQPLTRNDDRFPGGGSVAHCALLLAERLVGAAAGAALDRSSDGDGDAVDIGRPRPIGGHARTGRFVPDEAVESAWGAIVSEYRDRFKSEYRDDPDSLRGEALSMLANRDLVLPVDGGLLVRPVTARYRADVRLVDTQLSLLGGSGG